METIKSTHSLSTRGPFPRSNIPFKVCNRCKQEKPNCEFHNNIRQKDGMSGHCRDCQAKSDRQPRNRFSQLNAICKQRKIEQRLTFEEWFDLISKPCEYCAGPLDATGRGLDRKEHEVGYMVGNVVPCCGLCNDMKRGLCSYEDMKIIGPAMAEVQRARLRRGEPPLQRNFKNPGRID